ncbi:MAG: M23 family metallopeptidase [Gammaproteobacteria bacterium]|nr:M23 family metallopeptidase [Gammaproteobacteria bacterium]
MAKSIKMATPWHTLTALSLALVLAVALTIAAGSVSAQSLYKYRGENGEWIYSDRPPDDGDADEVRALQTGSTKGTVDVAVADAGQNVRFIATNRYHVPIQLQLRFSRISGLARPKSDDDLTWILPPSSDTVLLSLAKQASSTAAKAEYEYEYIAGDPRAAHRPGSPYRVPFAIAANFPITQAYPDVVTHKTVDSYHAVDIAMPVGTDIFAARDGIVFDVSSDNFEGGLDPTRDGPSANIVQILHDDGTYALYAHLNWNSIRVKPGDRVARGEYIADSGNTGFSSGPHLHFAVLRNAGLKTESVPIRFEGANSSTVVPATGSVLTAY